MIMKTIEELKQEIRDNVKIESVDPPKTGGQTTGRISQKIRLHSEDLQFTIEAECYNNRQRNKELLMTLFELVIDEMIY